MENTNKYVSVGVAVDEETRLRKENARLKEKLHDARERANKWRSRALELGYTGDLKAQ